jgi:hypothetical protein
MNKQDNLLKLKDYINGRQPSTPDPLNTKKLSTPFREKSKIISIPRSNNLKYSSHQYSNSTYVPYSVSELEKQVKYFNSCSYYEYASALNKYLELLRIYKRGSMQYPPKYPELCMYQPEPKEYKRPAMYQGIGRTASVRTHEFFFTPSKSYSKYKDPPVEKKITILHEIPQEICITIK